MWVYGKVDSFNELHDKYVKSHCDYKVIIFDAIWAKDNAKFDKVTHTHTLVHTHGSVLSNHPRKFTQSPNHITLICDWPSSSVILTSFFSHFGCICRRKKKETNSLPTKYSKILLCAIWSQLNAISTVFQLNVAQRRNSANFICRYQSW